MKRIRRDIVAAVLLFLFLVLHSPPSLALQPVETFLAGAREGNPDELEARATALQQQGQALSALGRVLPGVAANGSYARNQYSSAITLAEPGQPTQTVPSFLAINGMAARRSRYRSSILPASAG